MVSTAYRKHRKILREYSQQPYKCVALDEATTSGFQVLHFVLENPLLSLPSYTCNTIRMEGLKATDYFPAILRGFHFINIANINIGTAQKKAFNYKWKDSIRNCGNPNNQNIIFVPCLCHLISNSYKAQAEANIALKNVVDKLHSYSHL